MENHLHRKEEHTRSSFAYNQAVFWYDRIKHSAQSGNILDCKATKKFLQARRIYIHYNNEYQKKEYLPLSK